MCCSLHREDSCLEAAVPQTSRYSPQGRGRYRKAPVGSGLPMLHCTGLNPRKLVWSAQDVHSTSRSEHPYSRAYTMRSTVARDCLKPRTERLTRCWFTNILHLSGVQVFQKSRRPARQADCPVLGAANATVPSIDRLWCPTFELRCSGVPVGLTTWPSLPEDQYRARLITNGPRPWMTGSAFGEIGKAST